MGWKSVKEHYRIEHIVHATSAGICIGSSFISEIIVISLKGDIAKRYDSGGNDNLRRYQAAMDADPETLRRLIEAPDQFSAAVPVYTYQGGEIVEKFCEVPGWPNVTHDGELMYENTFSTDKSQAVSWAKRNAESGIRMYSQSILDAETRLLELRKSLAEEEAALARLEVEYPSALAS